MREVAVAPRLARDVVRFLRTPLDDAHCHAVLESALATRDERFVALLDRVVFSRPQSVYGRLFAHAGIESGDVADLVRRSGVDAALAGLYAAGVYVTLDEFRGLCPLVRGDLELAVSARDFANPLARSHYSTRSSGSRSAGTLVPVDLRMIEHEAAHHAVFLDALDLRTRPTAFWAHAVPVSAGLKNLLRHAKVGAAVARWFSPNPFAPTRDATAGVAFTAYVLAAGRLAGLRLPWPERVPLARADVVARWLAGERTQSPAVLWTSVSAAVRVCLAAAEHGLDLTGTTFRVGGEPLTEAKARLLAAHGCDAVANYSMAEVGKVAVACADRDAVDDMHVLEDKLALLPTPRPARADGVRAQALHVTTLHARAARFLVNVETGDEGVLAERHCSCAFGGLGFSTHLHALRSYEKVTTEGGTFLGHDLVELVEVELPAAFGGAPTDYQLVEHEDDGPSRLRLIVSPRVGAVDEAAVVEAVVACLGRRGVGERLTAESWR